MANVSNLLRNKGQEVWSVSPDNTVFDALELMAEKNIGAVLVMDGEALVGIISERDYARKVVLMGKSSKDTLASEIMTPRVLCVPEDKGVRECMALMTDTRIRHLPVLNAEGEVLGLVSIGDLVKETISHQAFLIDQLERYITG